MSDAPSHPVLTINARGNLIGDLSHIPAETLEALQTPEARERMKAMYRQQFGSGRRELREKNAGEISHEQRDFRHLCPPGMSSREFRRTRRKYMREQTKSAIKEMRNANQPSTDSGACAVGPAAA